MWKFSLQPDCLALRHLDPHLTGNRFLQPDEFLAETHVVEPMPEAHWHDHVELNIITRGGMTYLINGRQVRLFEGAIYCFWAAVPHQVITAVEETELVCVYVPFADFLSLVVSSDFKNDLMAGHVLMSPSIDPADILIFVRWARQWENANGQITDILRDEVRLRVRRLGVDQYDLEQLPGVPHVRRWINKLETENEDQVHQQRYSQRALEVATRMVLLVSQDMFGDAHGRRRHRSGPIGFWTRSTGGGAAARRAGIYGAGHCLVRYRATKHAANRWRAR